MCKYFGKSLSLTNYGRQLRAAFMLAFLPVSVALVALSCSARQQSSSSVSGAVALSSQPDSVSFSLHRPSLDIRIKSDVPDASLALAVGEWVDEMLGGCYPGDARDMQAIVDFYGKTMTDSLTRELEGVPDCADLAFESEVTKEYETDRFVTYTMSLYTYLGGVHPSTEQFGVTFRKSDGRRLSWDIVRGPVAYEMREIIMEELKNYFGAESDEDLEQMLADIKAYNVPLPQNPPYLLENGMAFVYQQYEIAAYAYGMPSAVIPYERIKPLLTEWAKRLL